MEEKTLKVTNANKLNNSLKSGEILYGFVKRITKDCDIVLGMSIHGLESYEVTIPNKELTLYVPRIFRNNKENLPRQREYMRMYLGKNIPFAVTDINTDETGTIKGVVASMRVAREKSLINLKERNLKLPIKAEFNMLGALDNYLIVEWESIIQTISINNVTTAEVGSLKDFVRDNNIANQFTIEEIDFDRKRFVANRPKHIENKFIEKVYNQKVYTKGDMCVGKVKGVTGTDLILIEIEPEIMGLARMPENIILRKDDNITCEITGFKKQKEKILVANIRKIG